MEKKLKDPLVIVFDTWAWTGPSDSSPPPPPSPPRSTFLLHQSLHFVARHRGAEAITLCSVFELCLSEISAPATVTSSTHLTAFLWKGP